MQWIEAVMWQPCCGSQRVAESHDPLNTSGGKCIPHLTLAFPRVDTDSLRRNVGKFDRFGERPDGYDIDNLAIGIELDERYCEIAAERVRQHSLQGSTAA